MTSKFLMVWVMRVSCAIHQESTVKKKNTKNVLGQNCADKNPKNHAHFVFLHERHDGGAMFKQEDNILCLNDVNAED